MKKRPVAKFGRFEGSVYVLEPFYGQKWPFNVPAATRSHSQFEAMLLVFSCIQKL